MPGGGGGGIAALEGLGFPLGTFCLPFAAWITLYRPFVLMLNTGLIISSLSVAAKTWQFWLKSTIQTDRADFGVDLYYRALFCIVSVIILERHEIFQVFALTQTCKMVKSRRVVPLTQDVRRQVDRPPVLTLLQSVHLRWNLTQHSLNSVQPLYLAEPGLPVLVQAHLHGHNIKPNIFCWARSTSLSIMFSHVELYQKFLQIVLGNTQTCTTLQTNCKATEGLLNSTQHILPSDTF